MNDIARKKTEKLADEGYECIQNNEYERALEISTQLEELRYTAAFDIGAQAYVGLGEPEKAASLLRRGLELAPNVSLNWQLLGNILSDLNEFNGASEAYLRGLECDDEWKDSLYLNQAILFNRQDKYSEAIEILDGIEDEELFLYKDEAKISALMGLERFKEAEELASIILNKEDYPEHIETVIGRIASQLGRIYLQQGKTDHEVLEFAFHSLSYDPENTQIMDLIRDIDSKYSDNASYYRATIHCKVPKSSPDYDEFRGYYCSYDVIAESTDDLLSYVNRFEEGVAREAVYTVEEHEILEKNTTDPCGVYMRSGRVFYDDD